MNTQFQNLENKINDLVMRMYNAEKTLKENATSDIYSMRDELQKLINEFDLLKLKMKEENSDEKIDQEMIDSLISLIDDYITDYGTKDFCTQTFNGREIDDTELSINYSCEVELESATIDIGDYFSSNFSFEHDDFLIWIDENRNNADNKELIKLMPLELFELIECVIEKSLHNIDTSINFSRFEDFECEMDSYKKIEVTDISIDSDEMVREFNNEFDFDRGDIENIIKNYHNFKSEEISEENISEE